MSSGESKSCSFQQAVFGIRHLVTLTIELCPCICPFDQDSETDGQTNRQTMPRTITPSADVGCKKKLYASFINYSAQGKGGKFLFPYRYAQNSFLTSDTIDW